MIITFFLGQEYN
ncbi:hypothetical protein Zm00014a_008177 [Zea mays]|uniref:Uncharacterized protein n=1 Tax=Zea mays TaxID=4577 RepID=A0A3L6FFT6_MAIZE|nr:hypothetical protein Zm00014a_008177 [Zea mays]